MPLRGVPERGERPDLRSVVVVDPPVHFVVLEQFEDRPVGVGADLDLGLPVRGRRVREVPVRPRLARYRAEPPGADRELTRQRGQHRHVPLRLARHGQRAAALDGRPAARGQAPGPVGERPEQPAERGRVQAPPLALVAADETPVPCRAAAERQLLHHRVMGVIGADRQHQLRARRRRHRRAAPPPRLVNARLRGRRTPDRDAARSREGGHKTGSPASAPRHVRYRPLGLTPSRSLSPSRYAYRGV